MAPSACEKVGGAILSALHYKSLAFLKRVFTSHGPTVIMPSWYCAQDWFDQVGRFNEGCKGVPEDLLLFYESLRKGGGVSHVDEGLLMYRYHSQAATHSVLEDTIWYHRVTFLEEGVLSCWASFTIWNAGKQGRKPIRKRLWLFVMSMKIR